MGFHLTSSVRSAGLNNVMSAVGGAIGSTVGNSYIRIYSGEPPSQATLDSLTSATLSANYLVEFSINGKAITIGNTAGWAGVANALAKSSGLATWFCAYYNDNYNSDPGGFMVGSISTLNGDGVLRLNNPNIVAGHTYSMQNFEWTIPLNYNF